MAGSPPLGWAVPDMARHAMDIDNDLFYSLIFAPSSSRHLPANPITAPCLPLLSPAPMGFVSLKIGDGTARFRRATLCSSTLQLLMLTSVVSTNLFALYAFLFSPSPSATADVGDHKNLSIISEYVSLILREIEASERRLHQIEHELAGYETLDPVKPGLPPELKLVLARHPLPLGHDSRSGMTTMVSSVAYSSARPAAVALLSTFMSYRHAASCPTTDPLLLSKLISKACEPLPRLPLPRSLWNPNAKNPLSPCGLAQPRPLWAMPGWHAGRAIPACQPCHPRPGLCRVGLGPRAKLSEPSMGARLDIAATGPC